MVFDYRKLRGRIKEIYSTQNSFAVDMNIGIGSLSAKLNNHVDFSQREIVVACILLNIAPEDINDYFFCVKSSETRTDLKQ